MAVPPNLPVAHASGQTITSADVNDIATAANRIRQTGPTYYNFANYAGAVRNTDCSTAWALALADLNAVPGIVYFEGTALTDYWGLPKLILPNRCGIQGAGKRATRLRLNNSVNSDFVTNYQSTGAEAYGRFLTIRDLMLDCNKANQTAGRGIYIANPGPSSPTAGDDDPDNHTYVENVWLANAKTDGIVNTTGSEIRLHNVVAISCDGHGFNPAVDSWLSDCTAEKNGLNGFNIGGGSTGIVNCKAFYNGQISQSNLTGAGMYLGATGYSGGVVVSNFRSQDNKGHGVTMQNGRHVQINGLICDSNGWGGTNPTGANGSPLTTYGTWVSQYVGLWMYDTSYSQILNYTAFDRWPASGFSKPYQANAINLDASAANLGCFNHIDVRHGAMLQGSDGYVGAAVKLYSKATTTAQCHVIVNGTEV